MKPVKFDYIRAESVHHAVRLLDEHDGDARLISGGQSLGPMLNLRLARPGTLIDISRLPELRRIEANDREIFLGSLVTHEMLESCAHPGFVFDAFRSVARDIAYRAIRSKGTVGGSLAHADPAADWPTLLLALNATVDIEGKSGIRTVSVEEFVVATFTTSLEFNEMIIGVRIPVPSASARFGYFKFCRKVGELAEAIGCVFDDAPRGVRRVVAGALSGPARLLPPHTELQLDHINTAILRRDLRDLDDSLDEGHAHLYAAAIRRAIERSTS
jgi:aerobic carbon-monoxide dehydrogenase medium subunit